MDRRILKTKKCLKDALHTLLAQKPLEKITVTEICDAAQLEIGRASCRERV